MARTSGYGVGATKSKPTAADRSVRATRSDAYGLLRSYRDWG